MSDAVDLAAARLAGDLECPDLESPMPTNPRLRNTNVRLPTAMVDRLDGLVPHVGQAPELATIGRVTRSDVLRLAILRGLAELEREYLPAAGR